MAQIGCRVWMKHGALDYVESIGVDLKSPWGLGFHRMCKLKSDETVIFAYVVYKSKADRNRINKKVHADFESQGMAHDMPFDMKRFSVGGFSVLVEAK